MKTPLETRRFQRVHFRKDFGANDRIVKAKVFWRNLEAADIFDLSFGGMAASRPGLLELNKEESVNLTVELGDLPAFDVTAKVAWVQDFSVGLSFSDIGPEGHLTLRRFLSDKLVGASLVLVNPETYPSDANYDLWYSGPRGTNVFIKLSEKHSYPSSIQSAEVDMDGDRMMVNAEQVISGAPGMDAAIQILSHAPENYVELHVLLDHLTQLRVKSRGE